MKRKKRYLFLIVLLFAIGCGKENESLDEGYYLEREKNYEIESFLDNEHQNELVGSNEDSGIVISIGDSTLSDTIEKTVSIHEGEQLEKAEWIEKNIVYRVAVERSEDVVNKYRHLRDYIYVLKDHDIKMIEVTYPEDNDWKGDRYVWSNCSFDVIYEDVTFDGNKDILVSLGEAGNSAILKYCAYVYLDGEYIYKKAFEEIGNFKANADKKIIEGWYTGEAHNDHYIYEYVDGDFVFRSVEIYQYDYDVNEYVYVRTLYSLDELVGN